MGRRKRSIDMLSGLPDEILCHILSFLPTKLSVCTSLLAKRWRFLWTHVPNLQFYADHLDNINRVIMLHEAKTVNTFKLSKVKGLAYKLETLIIYPIKHGVQNLCLDFGNKFGDDIVCTVPRRLFTCKTLVDLKLDSCGVIPSSAEMFLPSLKKLNLSYVEYADDESLPHLLSGCPVLEELTIYDCFREGQKYSGCFTVSSPTVKMLHVDLTPGGEQKNLEEMLIIDVPALVYLKVNHCDLDCVRSLRKTMTSLIEAKINLNGDWHTCEIDCTEHGRSFEFLSCLRHVKYLKMKSDFEETLFDMVGNGSMPKFVNLTKLKFAMTVEWYDLVKFLEFTDNLEVLVFHSSWTYKEPKRVPTCMLSCLRTVQINWFSYSNEGCFEIVRYILKNAQVLEMIKIDSFYDLSTDKQLDVLGRILSFERGSKSCQVVFDSD